MSKVSIFFPRKLQLSCKTSLRLPSKPKRPMFLLSLMKTNTSLTLMETIQKMMKSTNLKNSNRGLKMEIMRDLTKFWEKATESLKKTSILESARKMNQMKKMI